MPTIQRIAPHPRKPDRVTVHIDGHRAVVIAQRDLERLGLRTGDPVPAEVHAQLAQAARALLTYDRAVGMLARRPRAVRDLRQRLLRAGEEAPDVDAALDRLQRSGLLDDEAFARHFARCKLASGSRSQARVRAELIQKGVPREIAAGAVAQVSAEEGLDETAGLAALAARKLRALRSLDAEVQRRRLFAFLQRRGFRTADILAVLRRVQPSS